MSSTHHLPVMDLVIEYAIGGTMHFLFLHIYATTSAMRRIRALSRARRFIEHPRHSLCTPLRRVIEELNAGEWCVGGHIQFDIILNSHMRVQTPAQG